MLAMLLVLSAVPAQGQDAASPESKALNHQRFVSGAVDACRRSCAARSGAFAGQGRIADDCEGTCACIGDQLGSRISGDDLWNAYRAERDGASRQQAMAPHVATITMGYRACGFQIP